MAFSVLKAILVIGATSAQGIPVVRALTPDRAYAVQAMTRNADGPDAKLIASWPNVQLEERWERYIGGSLDYATKAGGWDDKFRYGHYDGKGKFADWVLAQPRTPMASSILTSGPYMELLFEFMLPKKKSDGSFQFVAPFGGGAVPLIYFDDLGLYARYLFDNQSKVNGLDLKVATQHVHWSDLASTFKKITGEPSSYLDVSPESISIITIPLARKL